MIDMIFSFQNICLLVTIYFFVRSLNTKIGNYPDSDDEIVVGSFCGKPLYRKRILDGKTLISSGQYVKDLSELSLSLLVGVYGCGKGGIGYMFPFTYFDNGNSEANVYVDPNGALEVVYRVAGTFTGFYGWLYIEYTKTTD
jgi:hypothetical protein